MAQRADITLRPNALTNDVVLTKHGFQWQDVILTARTGSDITHTVSYSLIDVVAAPPGGGTDHMLSLSDIVTMSDDLVKAVGKVASDIITASDDLIKAVGKLLSDTTITTDEPSKAVGKPQTDSVTTSDAVVKAVGKAPDDTVTPSDALAKAVGKPIADTTTISDLATVTLGGVVAAIGRSITWLVTKPGYYTRHGRWKR